MNALREFAVSLFARPMLNLFTWDELARRSLWDWYGFGPGHVAGVATEPDAFEQLAALSAHLNGRVRERVVVARQARKPRVAVVRHPALIRFLEMFP